jgi:rubrerythrin
VKGFVNRKPIWLNRILTVEQVRNEIGSMEQETRRFYEAAAQKIDQHGGSPTVK